MSLTAYQKDFLTRLISIKSVGGEPSEGAPYGNAPRAALDFFLKEAEACGFRTGVLDDRVGWAEIGSGERLIGIVCHLDVVPAGDGWDTDPFTLTFRKGNMYGRGIVDDKGPAAASFFAMREILSEGGLDHRIRLILGTDEERTCSCVEYYDENGEVPDFAITPDAEFPVIYAEKGILHVKISGSGTDKIKAEGGSAANMVAPGAVALFSGTEVKVNGKPAHASRPELGINAINALPEELVLKGFDIGQVPLLPFIAAFDEKELLIDSDESGSLTANFGILKIDENESSLIVDIRYPVTADKDLLMERLSDMAEQYGLRVAEDSHMAPICFDKDKPEIRKLTSIWRSHIASFDGYEEGFDKKYSAPLAIGGGTYARHIRNTVAFGIQTPWQEDQCHMANEHMSENNFEETVKMIKEAVR